MGWDTASANEIMGDLLRAKVRAETEYESIPTLRHIQHKVNLGELKPEIAEKMVYALQHGAEPNYRSLLIDALRSPLAPVAYHTAPSELRALIQAQGLRMALPADGHWNINAGGQPRAVYLAPEPDVFGKFALTQEWDIWEVTTDRLRWSYDQINWGCWAVTQDISPDRLRLHSTLSRWDRT